MRVVIFPAREPEPLPPHPAVQRARRQILHWLAGAQRDLARLPGSEPADHQLLRALADELVRRLVD